MRNQRLVVAVLVLGLAAGCSRTNEVEAARTRAEMEELRADVARLRGQFNEVRAEVDLLRAAGPTAPPTAGSPSQTAAGSKGKGNLTARFEAAVGLTEHSQRQQAFAVLMVDAASYGDVDVTRKCLEKITEFSVRQDLTYRSALRLAAAGKTEDAVTLAKALAEHGQKQKALAKIAEGNYRE